MNPILFAGGDQRTVTALAFLKERGYPTESYALSFRAPRPPNPVSALVLPYPALKNGRLNAPALPDPPTLEDLIAETGIDPALTPVIGGPLQKNPFPLFTDLSQSAELKERNAVTTAEGALALLIGATQRSLRGSRILTVGYGAIGRRLSDLLMALGAEVTVAARKEADRERAKKKGFSTVDTAKISLDGIEAVVNTVPAPLLDAPLEQCRRKDLLLLELASPPYGADPQKVKSLGIAYLAAPGLPGKTAPVTAGKDLALTLMGLLPPL